MFMLGSVKKEVPRSENTTFSLKLEAHTEVKKDAKTRGPRLSVWEVSERSERALRKTRNI